MLRPWIRCDSVGGFARCGAGRGWRQVDLARAADLSQSAVSRVELGEIGGMTVACLESIGQALGARVDLFLRWQNEALDRLVDAAHASTVEQVVAVLDRHGWMPATEVSFSVYGERGSIDVLAAHPSGRLLVVEVKSRIGDVQDTLVRLDRKARLAAGIARERGLGSGPVSRLLVVAESATARRRVREHTRTFRSVLPDESLMVRRWLRDPAQPRIAGLWFMSPALPDRARAQAPPPSSSTRRVGVRRPPAA